MTISADTWQARDHISLHHLTIWNSHVIIASLIIIGHTLCVLRLIWNWELQQSYMEQNNTSNNADWKRLYLSGDSPKNFNL